MTSANSKIRRLRVRRHQVTLLHVAQHRRGGAKAPGIEPGAAWIICSSDGAGLAGFSVVRVLLDPSGSIQIRRSAQGRATYAQHESRRLEDALLLSERALARARSGARDSWPPVDAKDQPLPSGETGPATGPGSTRQLCFFGSSSARECLLIGAQRHSRKPGARAQMRCRTGLVAGESVILRIACQGA